ncbi:hypothetical protein TWF225_011237 [Orbilia oligospora]|nr:hypothetical protein TWF225_011237 [Orbilia oligospora]KAF3247257.1 hypothetical protein TWF217_009668 [Orbilia oligospora]KAF3256278.1 hypothetical protein TWF128_005348 [Orbilia oligospora]KAF3280648.1 hypothetical protein TWF132_011725 [Orbilia oligospora]
MLVPRNCGPILSLLFFGTLTLLFFIEPSRVLPGTISVEVLRPFEEIHTPNPYNETKLALLIENRPQPHLTPLLLHFMSVVPPEWPFLFLGSNESITHIQKSGPIRNYISNGKLSVRLIPEDMNVNNQENLSRTMTRVDFYEMLSPAEWLFIFQTDSIICANSGVSLNDWVERGFSWVGASWGKDTKYGGNGGFNLRRVSYLVEVLTHQNRHDGEKLEDWWLTDRLGHMPNAKMANGTEEMEFSVEKVPYDTPLGYHTGWGGKLLMAQVWKEQEQRDQIFEYCPEIKILMPMVPAREAEGCDKDISSSFPS